MRIQKLLFSMAAPFARMASSLSEKKRFVLGAVCILLLFGIHCLIAAGETMQVRYLYIFAVGGLALAAAAALSLREPFQPVQWNRLMTVCWFGTGVFMMQAGLRLNADYFSDGLMFILVLPLWFVFWGGREDQFLHRLLTWSGIASFVLVLAVDVIWFPYTGGGMYCGLFYNPNAAGEYYTVVFVCLLVELLRRRCLGAKGVFLAALAGICAVLTYYCGSRSGQLAVLITFLFTGTLYLLNHREEWKQRLLVNLLPVVLCTVVMLPCAIYIFQLKTVITSGFSHVWSIQFVLERNMGRLFADDKILGFDQFSSGRISIWRGYFSNLNLLGHDVRQPLVYYSEYWQNEHAFDGAHMVLLEFAYRFGIPCGVFFLVYNLCSGIAAIRYGREKAGEEYALLPLSITVAFGVVSLLASARIMYTHVIALYYALVQPALLTSLRKKPAAPRASLEV